jgi:UDP-sugar transporter A1/2/3
MRNAQLAFFSTLIGVTIFFAVEPSATRFFQGYNGMVAAIIMTQAAGGLIIAVVVKYADNILKGFATAISIVLCGILSVYLMGFNPGPMFIAGSVIAIIATMMYSY